jgi:hypothetical protein
MTAGESRVVALLREDGFITRTDLGQHFLCSTAVGERLVALAGLDGHAAVLEVGAGLGTLSRTVAGRPARLSAPPRPRSAKDAGGNDAR